ncbi:anti-anti-sigma factor [Streptomyces violarus]|uniref:Anti-anti-sigma factor n=1 Tax=Streptomyces violarus TaxID=67380 RepID=A0A7W4ZS09_9ACTN|nr:MULTISPECIES: STAS domain-containing protein [Streptomyces]MBB3077649.1 anti-anti-sigma factor [Streptomyces violarus]WRU00160.1 STAS domain-containing protein [Streptomyces sp. CGMCC 4.1772]
MSAVTFIPNPTEPRDLPGRVCLTMPAEIDFCNAAELLPLIMTAARDHGDRLELLVLDLSCTSFMDSQGVRLINDIRHRLRPEARVRLVARPDGVTSSVLELTGLRRDVPVYDNLAEAMAS